MNLPIPNSRIEKYLEAISKNEISLLPYKPKNRIEIYLDYIAKSLSKLIDDSSISDSNTYSSKKIDENIKNKADSNHTHDYLPNNGGTLKGRLDLGHNDLIFMDEDSGDIIFLNKDGSIEKARIFTSGDIKNPALNLSLYNRTYNLILEKDKLKINGNTFYHTGNKPTPSDIGASPTNHTHNYIPISLSEEINNIFKNEPNNINKTGIFSSNQWNIPRELSHDGQGTIINISYNSTWRTQFFINPHYGTIFRRNSNHNSWSSWINITTSSYSLEQDLTLLEQDLRIMSIEKILKQDINTLENNKINSNSYDLLLRIIENINLYNKDNLIYSKDKILNIINIYFDNKKIDKKQANNLIKLINSK